MTGNDSPIPFIKEEPSELHFDTRNYLSPSSFNMSNHNNHQFGSWQGVNGHIDPSDLSMGSQSLQPTFGSSQNLSSNFIAGNALIGDDELLDLVNNDLGGTNNMQQSHQHQNSYQRSQDYGSSLFNDMQNSYQQNTYANHIFSSTPEGAPIQSPFMHAFNYGQWGSVQPQRSNLGPQRTLSAAMANGSYDIKRNRPTLNAAERASSDSRSPMTPRTPAIAGLHLGTPDPMSMAGQPIRTNSSSRNHQKRISGQWEGTPGSALSYLETPLSSPGAIMNPQITGLMQGSLPKKSEQSGSSKPGSSLEAKRQKRRESHNAVERRRRNNINDRIQELSRLVPQHRLEDDTLRKAIGNGTAIPGALTGSGLSPPRRSTGGITQGLPIDDKDKGPAKGDVLNGAVSWTRDLMWYLRVKMEQEAALMETIESLGGQVPYQVTDAEQRMRTEFLESLKRNDANSFDYTRSDGTGLWVPGHTDQTGQRLSSDNSHSNTVEGAFDDAQFWGYTNEADPRDSLDLKEEDDYGMELN